MNIHEFGQENREYVLFLHASCTGWDFYEESIRLLADNKIQFDKAVIDAGITPYQLPWILTWFIAVRDFLMVELGKHSRKLLELAYPPEKYKAEDLDWMERMLKHMSARTIWRVFDSCNNYSMPKPVPVPSTEIQYWYGSLEKKARAWDIAYVKKNFPGTRFVEISGLDHAEYALLHP